MIIAAYAGTGKSTLAKLWPSVKEITSMQYTWILPQKEESEQEHEAEKAARYLIHQNLYPHNMLHAVLKAEKDHSCVIIPSVDKLVQILQQEYGRNVVLCYPEDGLLQEYEARFKARGNTSDFTEIFVDRMPFFLEKLKRNKNAHHIVLKSGEFLSDKRPELEQLLAADQTLPVPQEQLDALEDMLAAGRKGNGLMMLPLHIDENICYPIVDLEDEKEKRFIYEMGRKLGGDLSHLLMIVKAEIISQMLALNHVTMVNAEGFERELDQWILWNKENLI